jgi:hypothetical protein
MGLTPEEFLRTLPAALGDRDYSLRGQEILIRHPHGRIRILLHPIRQRKIGMLTLPVTSVEFCLQELGQEERQRFMTRFERYFQRGGG